MMSWKDANKGYAGHFWYTYTHAGSAPDSCFATWTPNLAQAGAYEVFAYIPYSNATAARYKVSTIAGQRTVEIDQKAYRDAWVSLGTYDLGAGSAGVVRLGDASTADRQELVFDAVRWSYRGTATVVERAGAEPIGGFALEQNFPNPFNPSTILRYTIPVAGPVRLAVFDPLGREVAVLVDALKPAGRYEVEFDGGGLTSGTYFVRLTTGTLTQTAGCSWSGERPGIPRHRPESTIPPAKSSAPACTSDAKTTPYSATATQQAGTTVIATSPRSPSGILNGLAASGIFRRRTINETNSSNNARCRP